jgi:hypothetical protein
VQKKEKKLTERREEIGREKSEKKTEEQKGMMGWVRASNTAQGDVKIKTN